jgi:hypothetical protein
MTPQLKPSFRSGAGSVGSRLYGGQMEGVRTMEREGDEEEER